MRELRAVALSAAVLLGGCATMPAAQPSTMTPSAGLTGTQGAYIAVGSIELGLATALTSYLAALHLEKGAAKKSYRKFALIAAGVGLLVGGSVAGVLLYRPPQPQLGDWLIEAIPVGAAVLAPLVTLIKEAITSRPKRTPPTMVAVPAGAPTGPREANRVVFSDGEREAASAFAGFARPLRCVLTRDSFADFRRSVAADHAGVIIERLPASTDVSRCQLSPTERGQEISIAVE